MPSSFFTRNQLNRLYTEKILSTYDISKRRGCDPKTVYYWLKRYNISTRPRKVVLISKTRLEQLYKSGLSLKKIGKEIDCTPSAVLRKFRKYGIATRTTWENNFLYKRHNFSKDLREKAYLIGFRIGDLNVVQRSQSLSVIVKSNTTKMDQVYLLKKLFSGYGPVWVGNSKSRPSVYHLTSSLNSSFSFLTKKHSSIPKWIMRSKRLFLSFLAGYSDAEGSIGVYDNRASFRIGSYDYTILKQIHKTLNNYGFKNKINLETRAGVHGKIKHNGDFYRVGIRDRYAVHDCLTELLPYLKHRNRIKCARLALKNVRSRM